jgi:hypothetical protein
MSRIDNKEDNLKVLESIRYSTVRIEGYEKDGGKITGTGFIFRFYEDLPVLITNKHVIDGLDGGMFYVCKSKDEKNMIPSDTEKIAFAFKKSDNHFKYHPDPEVDLCAMQIGSLFNAARDQGQHPFYRVMSKDHLPREVDVSILEAIEDIYMIGYPNGIWDEYNNKPIIRKGITATKFSLDYNNRKEFLIDAACFPGSSGSPVIIYKTGYWDAKGNYHQKPFIFLLGVLYAGPQHTTIGEIQVITSQTSNVKAISMIPNNLGFVIKSHRIIDLEKLFSPNERMDVLTHQDKVINYFKK